MEELIDVLDENGNQTGEIVTREQIHKLGLSHIKEIISNDNVMNRQEFYEKIVNYLK